MKFMFNVVELKFKSSEYKFNDSEHKFNVAEHRFLVDVRTILCGEQNKFTSYESCNDV